MQVETSLGERKHPQASFGAVGRHVQVVLQEAAEHVRVREVIRRHETHLAGVGIDGGLRGPDSLSGGYGWEAHRERERRDRGRWESFQ